jgi:hypothetical protein
VCARNSHALPSPCPSWPPSAPAAARGRLQQCSFERSGQRRRGCSRPRARSPRVSNGCSGRASNPPHRLRTPAADAVQAAHPLPKPCARDRRAPMCPRSNVPTRRREPPVQPSLDAIGRGPVGDHAFTRAPSTASSPSARPQPSAAPLRTLPPCRVRCPPSAVSVACLSKASPGHAVELEQLPRPDQRPLSSALTAPRVPACQSARSSQACLGTTVTIHLVWTCACFLTVRYPASRHAWPLEHASLLVSQQRKRPRRPIIIIGGMRAARPSTRLHSLQTAL